MADRGGRRARSRAALVLGTLAERLSTIDRRYANWYLTRVLGCGVAALGLVGALAADAAASAPVNAKIVVRRSAGGATLGPDGSVPRSWSAPTSTYEFMGTFGVRGRGDVTVYSPTNAVRWISVTAPGWTTATGVHVGTRTGRLRRAYGIRLSTFDGCSSALSNGLVAARARGYVLDARSSARTFFAVESGRVAQVTITQRRIARDITCEE